MDERMKLTWKTCFRIVVSVFILYLGIYYWSSVSSLLGKVLSAAVPILIGLIIAYALNILMSFYERHYFTKRADKPFVARSRRTVCMLAAVITLFAIVSLVIWLVIPELVSCVGLLISEIPPTVRRVLSSEFVSEVLPQEAVDYLNGIDWNTLISNVTNVVVSGVGSMASYLLSAATSVISAAVTAFLSIIFAIYLLIGKERLQVQFARLIHTYLSRQESNFYYVARVFNESFRGYITGQCTEAVILGILCIIGMLIFRFPYAGMIGTLIGFTALIPIAGAYIGAIVGAVMIFTVSPLKALLFLLFIVILQQLEGNLIYPKVVGKSIGLPAFWVLVAITIGGGILGIVGMLIGVPIAAAFYRLLRHDVRRREAETAEQAAPPQE